MRVGERAEKHGRKPLLLVGFAALPIRAVLFALTNDPLALIAIQLLDGITGAVLGVMTALVIADVTKGTRTHEEVAVLHQIGTHPDSNGCYRTRRESFRTASTA